MATYKHLRSSTANKRPTTSITDGQLAINTNTASPGLFFKDSAGTGIVKVGPVHVGTTAPNATPAAGGSSGNYTGEQWLDTSVSPAQMKVWNGSAWVGIVADELPVSKLQDGAARQLLQTDAAGTGVEWTSNVDVPGTLDVTGATTLDSTLTVPLGSAASPTLRFSGDANSGLYSPGADQVAVATNGTGRLFVDASGNVLVGTASSVVAGYKLQVNGSCGVASTANASIEFGIRTPDATFNDAYLSFGTPTQNRAQIYCTGGAANTGSLVFNTYNAGAGSERLRITSVGLVGIGNSAPNESLHVNGAIRFTSNSPALAASDGGLVDWVAASGELRVTAARTGANSSKIGFITYNSGSLVQAATIDSSGRLLVGTSSTSAACTQLLQGSSGGLAPAIQVLSSTASAPANGSALAQITFTDSGHVNAVDITARRDGGTWSGTSKPTRLEFSTTADGASSPTERMRIGSNGAVAIGTTSTIGAQLAVVSDNATKSPISTNSVSGDLSYQAILVTKFDNNTTTSQNFIQFQVNNGAANCGRITANGANTAAFGSTSDIRLKENIEDLPPQLQNILNLRPVEFDYTKSEGGGHQIGFIAQEMQAVYPDVVNERGEDDMLMITGWSKTEARLVKAIQEQQAMIAELQAEVAALKAQ
jgi:hypothetical protein